MKTVITPILSAVAPSFSIPQNRRFTYAALLLSSTACGVQEGSERALSISASLASIHEHSQARAGFNAAPTQIAASPLQERLWKKYVAAQYEQAILDNAEVGKGIHLCDVAGGQCDFQIDYDRSGEYTSPALLKHKPEQDRISYYTSATVNTYTFVHMTVEEDSDVNTEPWTSINVSDCKVVIEDDNGVPLNSLDARWSSKYVDRPEGPECNYSTADTASEWLKNTYSKASPQPQAVVCACPPNQIGDSTCTEGSEVVLPKFNFNLAFFGTQGVQYTVVVKCGSADELYGYASLTPIAIPTSSDGTSTDQCNSAGTYPPTEIRVDGDGDGAFSTTSTGRGKICLPLPTRTSLIEDRYISFAAVEGDCDDTNPDISPFTLNSDCSAKPKESDDAYTLWLEQTLQATFSSDEAEAIQRALDLHQPVNSKINAGLATRILSRTTANVPYMTSPSEADSSGPVVASGIDLNADGFKDFAIAYPNAATAAGLKGGWVYIVAGGPSRRAGGFELELANLGQNSTDGMISLNTKAQRAVWILEGDSGCEAGKSMVTGDFDGDGVQDLAIGQPGCASPKVTVLFGHNPAKDSAKLPFNSDTVDSYSLSNLPPAIRSVSITSAASGRFGERLAAGDIYADGKHELIMGASGEGGSYTDAGGGSHKNGKVYLVSGATIASLSSGASAAISSLSPLYLEGANPQTLGGRGTIGAGQLVSLDFNHDGKSDLVLFAPKAEEKVNETWQRYGQVVIYGGDTMTTQTGLKSGSYTTTPKLYWRLQSQNELVEVALAVLPDVNEDTEHDGDELVIGAKNETVGGVEDAGMVYVVLSRNWTTQTSFVLPGADNGRCTTDKIRCFSGGIYGDTKSNMQLGSSVSAALGPYESVTGKRESWLVMAAHQFPNGTNSTGRVTLLATHPNVVWTPGLDREGWLDSDWNTGMQDIVIEDAYWFGAQVALIGDVDNEQANDGSFPGAPELLSNASYAIWTNTTNSTTSTSSQGQVSYLFYGGRGPASQTPKVTTMAQIPQDR